MKPLLTCFGETLWDVLPTSKQPGGAPMNVAVDLHHLGLDVRLISRVGDDELGRELLYFLTQKGIQTDLIHVGKTHLTGVAQANLTNASEVIYTIVQPVAWDYLGLEPAMAEAVRQSDFFVYGSLAARSPQTRETLMQLLGLARRNVFDVNLRAPHYRPDTVIDLLKPANLVKMNENELAEVTGWLHGPADLEPAMSSLYERFDLDTLCVTLGAEGAILLNDEGFFRQSGFRIEVADTIGSGDAFLAGLLYKMLQKTTPDAMLEFACATGAYVATHPGATPSFTEALVADYFHLPAYPASALSD